MNPAAHSLDLSSTRSIPRDMNVVWKQLGGATQLTQFAAQLGEQVGQASAAAPARTGMQACVAVLPRRPSTVSAVLEGF